MTPEEFKKTRKELGWTQSYAAQMLKVSWRTVARWEDPSDKINCTETAAKLLKVYLALK